MHTEIDPQDWFHAMHVCSLGFSRMIQCWEIREVQNHKKVWSIIFSSVTVDYMRVNKYNSKRETINNENICEWNALYVITLHIQVGNTWTDEFCNITCTSLKKAVQSEHWSPSFIWSIDNKIAHSYEHYLTWEMFKSLGITGLVTQLLIVSKKKQWPTIWKLAASYNRDIQF